MLDRHKAVHLQQSQGAHEILMVIAERTQFFL
jgi:hypothetical protein